MLFKFGSRHRRQGSLEFRTGAIAGTDTTHANLTVIGVMPPDFSIPHPVRSTSSRRSSLTLQKQPPRVDMIAVLAEGASRRPPVKRRY